MPKINLAQINTSFATQRTAATQELLSFADSHFSSIDYNNGNEVFFVSRKAARWLLKNCVHDGFTMRQAASALYLKDIISEHGMSKNWSDKPVVINTETCEIKDGLTRLLAISLSQTPKAVSLPIKWEE